MSQTERETTVLESQPTAQEQSLLVPSQRKVVIGERESIVFISGKHETGAAFFAYIALEIEKLSRLNMDMELERLRSLDQYGKVLLQGKDLPTPEQKAFMETHYAFDHSNPFAENGES